MSFWKPKPGPLVTIGRLSHFVIACVVPISACGAWGYEGLGLGLAIVLTVAVWWELGSRWMGWPHPWGDVIDLLAFVAGALAGGSLGLLICR